jgi:hypothetical protein
MALSPSTFSTFAGGVSDIFAAQGDKAKAQYDFAEGKSYGLAAGLAAQNEEFTATSTAIKEAQQQREAMMTLGGQRGDVAGAGFAESGSALDLLRDSASQGALAHAVIGQQGLITEAGYEQQRQSYQIMQGAANDAGNAANNAATIADITGGLKIVASIASLGMGIPPGIGTAPGGSSIGDPTQIGSLY